MSVAKFLHYLLLPARPTVLLLIATLSVGQLLALHAGLLGIALALLVLLWLFNYAYVLLEQVANGAREPPVLAIEMLNPVNEPRPLLQFTLLLLLYGSLRAAAGYLGPSVLLGLDALLLLSLPASIGTLGAGDSLLQAINPVVLWRVVRALAWSYLALIITIALEGLAIALMAERLRLPVWALVPAAQFACLSVFALIGGCLFEHRAALGYEPLDSPERRAARAQLAVDQERARFLDRVHGEARAGNQAGAWQTIEQELAARGHAFEFYDWLLERLLLLPNEPLAARLGQDYITRALGHDNARVTVLARRLVGIDPGFRPRAAAETLRVAELSRLAGDARTARALLADFERRFPGDPGRALAARLAEELRRD